MQPVRHTALKSIRHSGFDVSPSVPAGLTESPEEERGRRTIEQSEALIALIENAIARREDLLRQQVTIPRLLIHLTAHRECVRGQLEVAARRRRATAYPQARVPPRSRELSAS